MMYRAAAVAGVCLALLSSPIMAQEAETPQQVDQSEESPQPTPREPLRPADVTPIELGSALPDIELHNGTRVPTRLRSLLGPGKLVVIFYRGGWCPYCNAQLADLQRVEPQIKASGGRLVAISPDRPEVLARYELEREAAIPLLSDSKAVALRAFRVAYRVTDDEVDRLKAVGVDLVESSGEGHKLLPVPAVFIFDSSGTLIFRHVSTSHRQRLNSDELVAALER